MNPVIDFTNTKYYTQKNNVVQTPTTNTFIK